LVNDDWDFMAPRQDFPESDFIMPSLRSERVAGVVFGSDWSGSTYGSLVERFHAEKQECLDSLQPSSLVDIGFDTRVAWEKTYHPGDQIDKTVKGGGGTDFRPFFARVAELVPAPKVVVVLTDMAGSFPDNPPEVPTIWVTWEKNAKAPFGEVIEVEP
jgi:predicted metal-dependent peptidase